MTLVTAHRILIGAAIVFFAFYAVWQMKEIDRNPWAVVGSAVSALVATGFALYYRTIGAPKRDKTLP